jgi:hypothetical protein
MDFWGAVAEGEELGSNILHPQNTWIVRRVLIIVILGDRCLMSALPPKADK